MDTIEQTISRALAPFDGTLPPEAAPIVAQVVSALTERENNIASDLYTAAVEGGVRGNEARSVMEMTGIQFRLPAVDDDDTDRQRDSVVSLLDALGRNRDAHRSQGAELDQQVAEVKRLFGI